MPGYLDNNIWQGAGQTSQDVGDAFTRALVGTAALRYQRQQAAQQAMFEAQRIALERQRLQQQVPLLEAQTAYNRAGAEYDTQRTEAAKKQLSLGELVNQATQARQMVMNPGQGGQFQMPPQLAAAIPAGQYTQEDLASRLAGILGGAGAQVSMQNPASAVGNLAGAMYMQSPEGLRNIAMGKYPPVAKPGLSPEQQAAIKLYGPAISAAVAPETQTDLAGRKTTSRNVEAGLDLANIGLRGMFPGSTNLPPELHMKEEQDQEAPPPGGVMTATNPKTKQRIISRDGGQTWQPLTQ